MNNPNPSISPPAANGMARYIARCMRDIFVRALMPACVLTVLSMPAWSAQTDISNAPITNTSSAQVKPNIMLLMDTSGSMGWGHMPDEVESVTGLSSVGYKSSQCNILYYNPATAYSLPKKADGSFFPLPSFTSARYDAYDTGSSVVVNLQTSFKAYDDNTVRNGDPSNLGVGSLSNDTPQPAYYYLYSGPQTVSYLTAPCTDADTVSGYPKASTTTSSGTGTWSRVLVSSTSGRASAPDERQNFAIWYTYYRTRISLTKSAASLAFTPLTDSFRVGFITMNPKDTPTSAEINQNKYIQIADFNTTQRGLWFDKLFSQKPGGSSPAREGLARVGRHYAGQHDGINAGMAGDPLQYSCQQNFTIMTTDGYWNDQAETPNAGPVKINGVDKVGQQDGTLTDSSGLSPRPIWEGFADGTQITTDNVNQFGKSFCTGAYFLQTTSRTLQSTSQTTLATSQLTQSTAQNLQSTQQNLQSTNQILKTTVQNLQTTVQNLQSTLQNLATTTQVLVSTAQTTQSTSQNLQSTVQNRQSTVQNLKNTSQNVATQTQHMQTVTQTKQSTVQNLQSTNQNLKSTSQNTQSTKQILTTTTQNLTSTSQVVQSTTQTTKSTSQPRQSTVQNLASTTQILRSTSQTTASTSQPVQSTLQLSRTTSQTTISTLQQSQSTSQVSSCDASTERCTPVPTGSCTPGGLITCSTTTTGPTLVASCTPSSASASNSYVTTTCANTASGPTGTSSCTPASASSSNNYVATNCNTVVAGPTPVASCTNSSASSSNGYTSTSCSQVATGPTPVQSCTTASANSGNSYTSTTCSTNTSGPSGVASCSPVTATSGNNWTTTTCGTNNTSNVPVASCANSSASSGNSYVATTCGSVVTTNVPVSTCTNSAAASGNNYVATNCSTNNTNDVPVQTCTASSASSGNNWTTTSCNPLVTSNVGVQTCAASGPTSGNNWTTTTCGTNNTSNVGVSSCTASSGSSGNSWVTTTCPAPVVTTNVPTQTCSASSAASANNWVATTCATNNSVAQPSQSCTSSSATSANNWVTTSCPTPITTTKVPVQTCTASSATSANNWVATTCPPPTTTNNVPVATCTASSATSGNSWVTTTCPAAIVTTNVPVATCTAASAGSGNSYTTTTCPTPNTTSNVLVATCTAAAASSTNSYTTTTCAVTTVSGPTAVQTCTPVAASSGNSYQATTCADAVTSTGVLTCTPVAASAGNNWTETTCGTAVANNVPVLSCTASGPLASNQYTTTTCPAPITTTNVPVATCTAAAAAAGNNFVATSCPAPITTNNVPVQTCTPAAAGSGNSYTSTTCTNPTTGPTGVSSCSPISPTSGNNWVTTTCGTNNTSSVPAASCTASGPTSTNQYTTTTCPSPIVVANTPVQTCSTVAAVAGNSYTRTDCSANSTSNVPVQTCSVSSATSANNWVATSCSASGGNNGTDVPVQTCSPSPATSSNSWTTTTCKTTGGSNAANVPAASCVASSATSVNGWVTTTCPAPVVTTNVPVASCTAATASSSNNYTTTTCPSAIVTSNVPVQTCSAGPAAIGNNWTSTTCSSNPTGPTGVQTCTAAAPTSTNNWTTTSCATVTVPATGVASCTNEAASGSNSWTTKTCGSVMTGPTGVQSCTEADPASGNNYTKTTCTAESIGPTLTTTCTPAAASASNGWMATACPFAPGEKIQYTTTKTVTTTRLSNGVPTGESPTVVTSMSGPNDLNGVCYIPGVAPVIPNLPTPNPLKAGVDISPLPTAGPMPTGTCTAWPCSVTQTNIGGSINSVADVAQYYYATDLRPAANWPDTIAKDNVASVGSGPEDDRVKWQHMTTFSIALGVSGSLSYRPDYRSGSVTDGDFAKIRAGTKNWPVWPDPAFDAATNGDSDPTHSYATNKDLWNNPKSIDDFWHAAVNGRGQYFSAGNPTSVIAGLNGALAGIAATVGSGAAAAVSTQQPVTGDNTAFVASYVTSVWTGDVQAQPIDVTTGAVLALTSSNKIWDRSAQLALDLRIGQACDTRNIYLMRAGATNNMVDFAWNTSTCDSNGQPTGSPRDTLNSAEKAVFGSLNVSLLSQYPSMTDGSSGSVDQHTPAAGANLLNFLRGQHDLEGFVAGDAAKLYRNRDHVLGDIVNGGPVYVRAPTMNYLDAGYYDFKVAKAGRAPMLYVPANDGMLHAFYVGSGPGDAQGGKEAWAIIPSSVLPNLYKLADNNYKNTHQYYADGTPTAADAYDSGASAWKTILVGGLNLGGKGYYAIDITDPASPKTLWEFKNGATCYDGTTSTAGGDCNLGYTFGKPLVTKLADEAGTWVVMFTSGYNNITAGGSTGDGGGYLYVLNAFTGQIIYKIATGIGDATTPSGLAQINNFVDDISVSNTTLRVYGGDLLGNMWRFDVNDKIAPSGREATLVGTLKDPGGVPQPITIRPELAELNSKPMVLIATGRLLGASDVTDGQVQSVYGIFDDPLTAPAPDNLRTTLVPLSMTLSGGSTSGGTRTVACSATVSSGLCAGTKGWVLDLPDPGERVNVPMKIARSTLGFGSNVPQNSACVSGGYSWFNQVDLSNGMSIDATTTGGVTSSTTSVSTFLSNSLIVGFNNLEVGGSSGGGASDRTVRYSTTQSDGSGENGELRTKAIPPPGKRVSWREIAQ